ncbi:unnamed protein product [Effrenium voratum]|uniref:EF-hand domain-containing protein n=1 Tax=Effrenium voratum TaxID=2562239 RepID=A0AA36IVS6_9DINO|nr:unnamed protein product [Effrenium voratum]CAJ1445297.1 unnamed protein product [Effrenium voratum]
MSSETLSNLKRQSSRVETLGASLREYNKKKFERSGSKKRKPKLRELVDAALGRCRCFKKSQGGDMGAASVTLATDVEDLKQHVRQRLNKTTYSVKDLYKSEGFCQWIARSNYFENFTLFVIAVNSLWIWIDTDNNTASLITEAAVEFQIAENIFCAFFTFEWLVRLFAFRRKMTAITDSWFVFDTLLVSLMIVETWFTPLVMSVLQLSSEGMGDATILRLVRLLRLARMTRVAKLLRAFPEVLIMIKGISAAARSVFFTIFLLILVLYIFGIAFKQICDGLPIGRASFSTVPESMLTLLIHGVFMDDMAELVALIRTDSSVAFGTFIIFVLIASITLMNMLIGVLCEVVSMVGQSEREELLVEFVKRELLDIIIEADEDGDGLMSHAEFLKILESPEGLRALETVGVDPVGLIDYADTIFAKDDGDGSEDTVLFSHFMNEILQLRGSNTATVKDLINMRKVVEKSNKDVRKDLERLNTQLLHLEEAVKETSEGQDDPKAILRALNHGTNGVAKPQPMPQMPQMQSSAGVATSRDLSPVPLRAHMQSSFRKTGQILPNVPFEEGAGSKSVPNLEASLSQKLQEMQDILNELMSGPHIGASAAPAVRRLRDESSESPVPQKLRHAAHVGAPQGAPQGEGDSALQRLQERHRRDSSRTRYALRVYGRPAEVVDEFPRGRVQARFMRRPSRSPGS